VHQRVQLTRLTDGPSQLPRLGQIGRDGPDLWPRRQALRVTADRADPVAGRYQRRHNRLPDASGRARHHHLAHVPSLSRKDCYD
jgi:hypothetical protein